MGKKIKIAIAGLGNCASSLVQGLHYYKDANPSERVPGLMHVKFGDYHISDIEIVGAFEITANKLGKDVTEAIFEPPNCTTIFSPNLPKLGVEVVPGPISDGVASHMYNSFNPYDPKKIQPVNVADKLKEWQAEILVNFIPVGSEEATRMYAQGCVDAKVAFANGIPTFIVSDPEGTWPKKFADAGVPCAGDDIKSQLGATILHRTLAKLAEDRGIALEKTYQLNVGGNTDFENMKFEERLHTKRESKTSAVLSLLKEPIPTRIGPSDYVPFLHDNKVCYLYMTGRNFGDCPLSIDVKLSVEDSPNSAGVMIDVIRTLKIAKDRGLKGRIDTASSYFFKHPPVQVPDPIAYQLVEDFIAGNVGTTIPDNLLLH